MVCPHIRLLRFRMYSTSKECESWWPETKGLQAFMDLSVGLHHLCPMETMTLQNLKPPPEWFRRNFNDLRTCHHGTLPSRIPRIFEYGLQPTLGLGLSDMFEATAQQVPAIYVRRNASQAILYRRSRTLRHGWDPSHAMHCKS